MNIRARLVLSLVVGGGIFAGGCGTWATQGTQDRCHRGSSEPAAPMVCIDNTGTKLSVDPPRVEAFEEFPKNSGQPMAILFFAKRGTPKFQLIEKSGTCIARQDCAQKAGLCRVTVVRLEKDETQRTCEYGIRMEGFPLMDPEIVIKTCC